MAARSHKLWLPAPNTKTAPAPWVHLGRSCFWKRLAELPKRGGEEAVGEGQGGGTCVWAGRGAVGGKEKTQIVDAFWEKPFFESVWQGF